MSNDRYERIRDALAKGPTPGEWYWSDAYRTPDGRKTWSLIGDGGFGILSCDGEENSPQSVNTAAAELIAACDPDTVRALLAERDALLTENALRGEALETIRCLTSMNQAMCPNPVALTARLGEIHQIADAALGQEAVRE